MDRQSLQKNILEQPYQREQWQFVLREYFGVNKLLQIPQSVSLPANEIAQSAFELGQFTTTDGRLIGLFEVQLHENVYIERNRVSVRNLLRHVYRYDVDGALVVFTQLHKWRFSFVSEIRILDDQGNPVKKETEPKRFTYLLGQGESCRTAAERFEKLKGKSIHLNDLFDAFSVEKLNKEFFQQYKAHFEKFCDHLAENKTYRKLFLGSDKA
ncbi:MAG: hypothetical protein NZ522_01005, partial [Chitinophagales bacterium]|nr:hypothetical protein [Chitinophagales bacterium]